jgi:hypothetical protein
MGGGVAGGIGRGGGEEQENRRAGERERGRQKNRRQKDKRQQETGDRRTHNFTQMKKIWGTAYITLGVPVTPWLIS